MLRLVKFDNCCGFSFCAFLLFLFVWFRYRYNIETNMFSSGNISEKLRISQFDCSKEVVVDLYAGSPLYFSRFLTLFNVPAIGFRYI